MIEKKISGLQDHAGTVPVIPGWPCFGDTNSRVARKTPSLKTLQLLAKVLEVKPYQLLIPEDDQPKNYYEDFFLKLKGKIDPGLFTMIEKYIKEKG